MKKSHSPRTLAILLTGGLLSASMLFACSSSDDEGAGTGGSNGPGGAPADGSGGAEPGSESASGGAESSSEPGARANGSNEGNGTGCAGEMDACAICEGDGSSCGCSEGWCKEVVDEHNKIRAAVNLGDYHSQPQAVPPMVMMQWDPLIEAKAQAYATGLSHWDEGHSSQAYRNYESTTHNGQHGENMAIGGGGYAEPSSFIGEGWGSSEAQGCSLASCGGHYTQIVWRSSIAVGCGWKEDVPFGSGSGKLSICEYAEAGNSGGSPY